MDNKDFNKLLKKDKYQVFLFTCPSSIPFNFFPHPWFICNKRGKISRWEILFRRNLCRTSWGHLHLNFLNPLSGIEIFPYYKKYYWKGRMIGYVEGNKGSTAERMINLIENSKQIYKYNYKYFPTGPNSNTYVQWVLNNFSKSGLKLPWNSLGKRFNN